MSELSEKTCVPCHGGVPPLKGKALADLHKQLPHHEHWQVVNEHQLTRTFTFPNFRTALDFVNEVGELAEEQGHHPDILLAWGKAEITLWTHKIDGLTESDFIMAAKIENLRD
jgi:4a-hydroxytetrahydrobiopterin dehydratase